jgi:hypothetical protein
MSKKKFNPIKENASSRRKRHFESGGTLYQWRGRSCVIPDKKKESSKRKCRDK